MEENGLHVVAIHGMGIDVNFSLATPTPEEIVDLSLDKVKGIKADMLFVSCTNFRAVEAVPSLKKTGNPRDHEYRSHD